MARPDSSLWLSWITSSSFCESLSSRPFNFSEASLPWLLMDSVKASTCLTSASNLFWVDSSSAFSESMSLLADAHFSSASKSLLETTQGLVPNSILFCGLFTTNDYCKKMILCKICNKGFVQDIAVSWDLWDKWWILDCVIVSLQCQKHCTRQHWGPL